jgi:hypothetical protein
MKKNNILIAVIAAALAFTSCKKESTTSPDNTNPPVPANERLLQSYVATNSTSKYFTYNSDKTPKSYTFGNGTGRAEFAYLPNKVVKTVFANNVKYADHIYELVGGIASQMTTIAYDANGAVLDNYLIKYIYNSKKLLVKYEEFKNGVLIGWIERSYDANDNLVLSETKNANGVTTRTANYEYDTSLPDKSWSYGQFDSNGTGTIFPRFAKHMIKKITVNQGATTSVLNFSYTTDAQGFVLTGTVKDGSNVTQDSWTNTWQ